METAKLYKPSTDLANKRIWKPKKWSC